MKRLEDARFLTGAGRFVDDLNAKDALHAWVVRSPHAHAVIERIETEAARQAPGVAGVFTEADLSELGPLPCVARPRTIGPLIGPPRYALAAKRVRHVGDPVAFVVAETRSAAQDAAERLAVHYRVLPAVVDGRAALAAGAPLVWDEAPGNLAFTFRAGDAEATSAAMARAAHVTRLSLINNRVVAAPIEPRAGIARYEAATDTMRLTLTAQGVQDIRQELAESVFRIPRERIQLMAPDVGGGFGMKNFLYPEWVMLLWAARRLGRAVKWVAERTEDFLSDTQGRDNETRARLGLDAEGRFLALEVETVANLGAYLSSYGPGVPTNMTAMGGVYAIPAMAVEVRGAFTNTVPVDAYRGAGKPEANYLIERLVERAARETGRDPILLRQANIITSFPYRNAAGIEIDSGRFAENLREATARADCAGFAARREQARRDGRLRGIGVGCYLETARGAVEEHAAIRFAKDGTVLLLLGTQSNGQGHETSFPQIAAKLLGLPVERFRLVQADTERVPEGHGHGGARSMHMGGTALVQAAERVIAKGAVIAAHLMQTEPERIRFTGGVFHRDSDDGPGVTLMTVAEAARDPAHLPSWAAHGVDVGSEAEIDPGIASAIDGVARNHCDTFTFPSGCHVAEVEVDPETGRVWLLRYVSVDDFGRLINAMITAGQLQGGVAQGIGQAMLEATVYEEGSGQLLSASLLDYALPRGDDLPAFETVLAELPSLANPLGVKGSGQAGCMAAPQTVMAAILDALAPLGVTEIDMPATAERVWRAIRAAMRAGKE
ncbi:MAG TPA: xanthine dehydrogenase family protein molybdopterin-binding subunit [Acetobacteraceae bacterium]|nr:xanthine dehydrogenase family protein molybdopterin-binding subunit [Acetobacteraceae bacterium]